ncbi:MAG: polyribonucleotide nucleotidyltransferase [Ruminococcaceae bacterium]|nr:polyribonucleotide nucleotidyltransferase [Oscillospiraceae bacterium]
MNQKFTTTIAGREFTVETGELAQLASGSALVRYGDTVVLATATASAKPRDGIDFFPLSVDYEEKMYSVGKIPGGFLKREGKPSEKAILTSRVIDRPIRPLFPKDYRNDVGLVTTVMSVDVDNSPEVCAMNGASIAISISEMPFAGPVGAVIVGLVDGEFVINPTLEQREKSEMSVTVAGTRQKVVMIEAGANEVPEDVMYDAIVYAHQEIIKICDFIDTIVAAVGKEKAPYEPHDVDHEFYDKVYAFSYDKICAAIDTDDKRIRDERMKVVADELNEYLGEEYEGRDAEIDEFFYKIQKEIVRKWLIEDHKRVDGRQIDEIRPLSASVGLLPRTHGSGLFSRGQTQVLTIATLGAVSESQTIDGLDEETSKRYMHHYNFPSYSVGETKPSRGPGRREIGHGALAERALKPVIPSTEEFPYAIRLVSEVLSSNGSTSQGSVCGSTLALMDAGVPIKAPVAGISCGLITKPDSDEFLTMVDIQGVEDFYGDMDFKVAGTKKGITAIQMDIKVDGLTYDIIKEAFRKTRDARYYILDEVMLKAIPEPREHLSEYAPKIITTKVPVDKIKDVIGSGGKTIQKIIAETGVKIDIEDDGSVFILTTDEEAGNKALSIVEGIVAEPEVGKIYTGKVVKIIEIGAFVEFLPGREGLVHISKLEDRRVAKVEDVVSEGDEIKVKLMEIDRQGRFNLSRKDALNTEETQA